jgi:hypothetical protein
MWHVRDSQASEQQRQRAPHPRRRVAKGPPQGIWRNFMQQAGDPWRRRQGRGAARAHPPQPDPVPAAVHRRAGAAAADRPVQDRCGEASGRLTRSRRRARRSHHPARRTRRQDPADRPLRRPRARLAASGPAAVPAPRRHRAPAHLHRHRPQHAQRGAGPHRADRRGRATADLHPARFQEDVHHRRDPGRAAAAHRPGHRRAPRHQRHPRLQGRLSRGSHHPPPGVPGPPPRAAPYRGIPRPHRSGMARIPRPFRAAEDRYRDMRARLRNPLYSRAQLLNRTDLGWTVARTLAVGHHSQ